MRKNGGDAAFIRRTYQGDDEKDEFKISINGTPVKTVSAASLDNSHGYSTMDIEIPTTVLNKIKGDNFDLKFESVSGKTTTPLYEVRLMRN